MPRTSAPRCVSSYCRQVLDPAWAFCPYCGEDNRPPADRHAVPDHSHAFLGGDKGCCIHCGEPSDEPYNMSRKWRLRLAGLAFIGGALVGVFILAIRGAYATGTGPLSGWVATWYSDPVAHRRGRYSREYYYTMLGDDVSLYLGLTAAALVIISLWMFFKVPAPQNESDRNGWWEDDGDWKPLSRNR